MHNSNTNSVQKIFDDLEQFLEFCKDYGYKYDERNLYNVRSFIFQQFMRYTEGKSAKNMWAEDARKFDQNFSEA